MEKQPYYMAYESRYQTVYEAGAERWGHPLAIRSFIIRCENG